MNSSLRLQYLTDGKDLDTFEYSINKDELVIGKQTRDSRNTALIVANPSKEQALEHYLVRAEVGHVSPDLVAKNNLTMFTLSNNQATNADVGDDRPVTRSAKRGDSSDSRDSQKTSVRPNRSKWRRRCCNLHRQRQRVQELQQPAVPPE